MKSFIGNSSPARGWALLLALLLGAGMMISACGEEEVPAPTTPAPPPAPPPAPAPEPTPEPTGPATPTGLRASAGAGYIEWTWDAVEGAFGYQGQFSADAQFTDADQTYIIVAPKTSHRVHDQASGYFRVRSGTGTSQADLQFSDWSDAVSGSAGAAPAPTPTTTPLSVPGNVQTSTRRDTSITVTWDAVADAAAYDVEQQSEGSPWSGASCGGGGNQVTGTECVASGLDRGTQYSFRVRAVPDSEDTDSATSAWSSAINAATTGRAPVTLEDGGLNLRWRSEGEDQGTAPQITWTWDPVDDRALQPLIDHYIALLRPGNANDDCPNLSAAPLAAANNVPDADASYNMWHDLDSDISFTLTVADFAEDVTNDALTGKVRGLCVVRTWEDERKIRQFGEVSVVWGSTVPFSTTGAIKRDNTNTSVTTSIGWEFQRDSGFDYVLRLLTTGKDTGEATTDQADCAGGQAIQSPDSVGRQDVSIFHTERNPAPYTIYQLCARAENDYGATEWTFVGGPPGRSLRGPRLPRPPLSFRAKATSLRTIRDATRSIRSSGPSGTRRALPRTVPTTGWRSSCPQRTAPPAATSFRLGAIRLRERALEQPTSCWLAMRSSTRAARTSAVTTATVRSTSSTSPQPRCWIRRTSSISTTSTCASAPTILLLTPPTPITAPGRSAAPRDSSEALC